MVLTTFAIIKASLLLRLHSSQMEQSGSLHVPVMINTVLDHNNKGIADYQAGRVQKAIAKFSEAFALINDSLSRFCESDDKEENEDRTERHL